MPEREVRVGDFVEPHRVNRIRDVEQDAVAGAGTRRETDFRKHGDVVALVGQRRLLGAGPVIAAWPQAGEGAGPRVGKDARPIHDARLVGSGERNLDDVDAEERRVRIVFGIGLEQPASSSPDRTVLVPDP